MKKVLKNMGALILGISILTACGEKKTEETKIEKPIVIGQTFVVDVVDPLAGGTPWSLTTHGITESVFKLNEKGELVSRYVKDIKKVDNLNWDITLNENVKFSDGSLIDADAFANAMNTIMEKNTLSNATAGKVVFSKTGDYTVHATTERETQNLKALLTEWTNVLFKEVDGKYVFSGPFIVKDLQAGSSLDLIPNENYENSDKRGEVIVKAFQDLATMKLAFESGELDMAFGITPKIAKELKDAGKIVETIDAGYQYFGLFNLKDSILNDKKVREAISLGIDREDYIKALQGGKIANGLFAHYFPFAGGVEVKYNLDEAKKILDDDGWLVNKDGIREKDGKKLELNIITYNSRPDLVTMMQIMVSQFKELGINAKTAIVDAIDSELQKGNFDIALYAQHTAPTGDPSYFLNQFFRTNGGKNNMQYSSEKVDSLLDKLGTLEFGKESIEIAKEIQQEVYNDLPVLYLVDPEWNVALSERLKNYKPYSGDYYIVNENLYK